MNIAWEMECRDPIDGGVDRRGHDWRPVEPRARASLRYAPPSRLMEMLDATTTDHCDKCGAVRRTWPNGQQTHHAFRVLQGGV